MIDRPVPPAPLGPMDRSPLEYSHGIYIADAAGYGGAQGFAWFAAESDALAYLREELFQVYDDDEGLHAAIIAALQGVTTLKAIPRGQINSGATGVFDLRWAGSFDDLRIGEEPFEEELQEDFRENVFGDDRGLTESESDDFAAHLIHYEGSP